MDSPNGNTLPAARRVEVREFVEDMARLLDQVREGASFLLTSEGEVIAELRPAPPKAAEPASEQPRRLVGRLKGKIWMADNWDTWPEGCLEEIEENPIFPPENKGE